MGVLWDLSHRVQHKVGWAILPLLLPHQPFIMFYCVVLREKMFSQRKELPFSFPSRLWLWKKAYSFSPKPVPAFPQRKKGNSFWENVLVRVTAPAQVPCSLGWGWEQWALRFSSSLCFCRIKHKGRELTSDFSLFTFWSTSNNANGAGLWSSVHLKTHFSLTLPTHPRFQMALRSAFR